MPLIGKTAKVLFHLREGFRLVEADIAFAIKEIQHQNTILKHLGPFLYKLKYWVYILSIYIYIYMVCEQII